MVNNSLKHVVERRHPFAEKLTWQGKPKTIPWLSRWAASGSEVVMSGRTGACGKKPSRILWRNMPW